MLPEIYVEPPSIFALRDMSDVILTLAQAGISDVTAHLIPCDEDPAWATQSWDTHALQ